MRHYKRVMKKKKTLNHFSLTFSPLDDENILTVVTRLNNLPPHRAPYVAHAIQFYMENGEPYETDELSKTAQLPPSTNLSPDVKQKDNADDDMVEETVVDIVDALDKFGF